MRLNRAAKLSSLIAFLTLSIMSALPATAEQKEHHALSLIGEPKYKADFKHFDYVNPNAPKGGKVRTFAQGTFETLNPFPVVQGNPASGLGNTYDALMTTAFDEPWAEYGLIAKSVSYPDDFSSATFKLRKEARWHDGKPITADDVIYSFNTQNKINPRQAQYYKNVKEVKKTDDHTVTFVFDTKNNKELPQIVGQLTIMPKHYWTGKDKDGKQRDPSKTTFEIPLGSGPYKIKSVEPGKSITYERVKDYWAKNLPVSKGLYNFDLIEYSYFGDRTIAFEAFKAGKIDFFEVYSSKRWATEFTFKAFSSGKVKQKIVPEKSVKYMQAFVFNTRREKFKSPELRQALNYVFDFEWSNKNLFYNQYARLSSYFDDTELAAKGLPEGKELQILNEVKDQIPAEVFTKEYKSPVNGNSQNFRTNLRQALRLLKKAGWEIKNKVLINPKTGKQLTIDFLVLSPAMERVILPYIKNLERLGVKASVQKADITTYKRRLDTFDFDMIVTQFGQSFSPGNEQRYYWGSASADQNGSRNFIGIKNPAIDKLIDKIIFAKDRPELVAATKALDRVLLWNHYVIPNWYSPFSRISYWDRFKHPENLIVQNADCLGPCFEKAKKEAGKVITASPAFLTTWWYEPSKKQ